MALARLHVWNAGDLLKAVDLNGEFNNILLNPIALISPTTGVIVFTTAQTFPADQVTGSVASSVITSGTIAAGAILYYSTAATPRLDTRLIGTAGQLLIVSTSGLPIYSTGVTWESTSKTLYAQRLGTHRAGTVLTSDNFSLTTGWGTGATIGAIRGTDENFALTITAGPGVAANPVVTATFADGNWPTVPVGFVVFTGGTGAGVAPFGINQTPNSSGLVFQTFFTPVNGLTYTFSVLAMG